MGGSGSVGLSHQTVHPNHTDQMNTRWNVFLQRRHDNLQHDDLDSGCGIRPVIPQTTLPYLTLPYIMGKACYRLALRPPVGPMRIPELTLGLLELLGVFTIL